MPSGILGKCRAVSVYRHGEVDDKSQPYLSVEGDKLASLNCKVKFPGTQNEIACRHLATQVVLDLLQGGEQPKVNWSHYASADAIVRHVPAEVESRYLSLLNGASTVHLVTSERFGEYLQQECDQMAQSGQAVRIKLMRTATHVLALWLTRKPEPVVHYYDPNLTNQAVRCKPPHAGALRTMRWEDFAPVPSRKYFSDEACYFIVMDCDKDTLAGAAALTQLKTNHLPESCSATVFIDLMHHNLGEAVLAKAPILASMPVEQRLAILRCQQPVMGNGAHFAMSYARLSSASAYLQLLATLPLSARERRELLSSRSSAGNPLLKEAICFTSPDVVTGFAPVLEQMPQADRLPVLQQSQAGFWAVEQYRQGMVPALARLLQTLLPAQQLELLSRANEQGFNPVTLALVYKDPALVRDLHGLLQGLSPEAQQQVLLGPDGQDIALLAALKGRDDRLRQATLSLLQSLPGCYPYFQARWHLPPLPSHITPCCDTSAPQAPWRTLAAAPRRIETMV